MLIHYLLIAFLVFELQGQPLLTADNLLALKADMLRNINSQVNLQIANDAVNKPQSFNIIKQLVGNQPLLGKAVPMSLPSSVTSAIASARSFVPNQLAIQKTNPIDLRRSALVPTVQSTMRVDQPTQSIQLIQPVQQMQVIQPLQTIQQIQPKQSIQSLSNKLSLLPLSINSNPPSMNLRQAIPEQQIKYSGFQPVPFSLSSPLNNDYNVQSLNTNRIINERVPMLSDQIINLPDRFTNYAVQANPITNPVPVSFQKQNKVVGQNNLVSGLQNRIMASNCDVKGSGNFIYEI